MSARIVSLQHLAATLGAVVFTAAFVLVSTPVVPIA